MAKVTLSDDTVHITFKLGDEILSFHGAFSIPYTHISQADAGQPEDGWFGGMRLLGSSIPGVVTAGTFITGSGTVFYDFHHHDSPCLILHLNHERYERIVVQIDKDQDPEGLAGEISKHLASKSK